MSKSLKWKIGVCSAVFVHLKQKKVFLCRNLEKTKFYFEMNFGISTLGRKTSFCKQDMQLLNDDVLSWMILWASLFVCLVLCWCWGSCSGLIGLVIVPYEWLWSVYLETLWGWLFVCRILWCCGFIASLLLNSFQCQNTVHTNLSSFFWITFMKKTEKEKGIKQFDLTNGRFYWI